MTRIFTLGFLILVLAHSSSAQSTSAPAVGEIETTILQLEKEGREATVKGDVAAIEKQLAEDWLNINSDGSITTRAQLMESLRAKPMTFDSIENTEVKVRVHGSCAIVTGNSTITRRREDGQPVVRKVRFTRIYVDAGNGWKVVSAQSTPIAAR